MRPESGRGSWIELPYPSEELGQQFIDWVTSEEGQQAIAQYKIEGRQLFFPNAADPSA